MRELHVQVSESNREAVETVLDDNDVDSMMMTEGDVTHVFFAVPTAAVSRVLDEFHEADVSSDSYTVMTKAEYVQTPRFGDLQEEYSNRIRKLSTLELHAKIREMQWPFQLYYAGTVLSVVAATAGLLLDQPALVIGAMIIAPQASSALAAPAGILLGDWSLFTASIKEQALGLGIAIVGASLFAWIARLGGFVPTGLSITHIDLVGLRLAPTFLSTVGAIIAGVVGAFGYTTEQSTSLVGVMIAAALIPAAAAVGLAVAWTEWLFGFGAFLLLLVNILAINVGAMFTLLGMGYKLEWETERFSLREAVPRESRTDVYATLLVVLLVMLGTGVFTGANVVYSQQVSQEVEDTLGEQPYQDLSVSSIRSTYGGFEMGAGPTNVTVGVSRSSNQPYPDLAPRLEREIELRTGTEVRVRVVFTESQSANSGPSLTANTWPVALPSVESQTV